MKPEDYRPLVLGSLSLFVVAMLGFIILQPYFKTGVEKQVLDSSVSETEVSESTDSNQIESSTESFNIYKEEADLSNYKKIIYFAGTGFENIQNGQMGCIYDKSLLDGSAVCMYTSYYDFEHGIKDANDRLFDAFLYFDIGEQSDKKSSVHIFYDNRFFIPDYDSKDFAQDLLMDLTSFCNENGIDCDLIIKNNADLALGDATMPAVYIKLEGESRKTKVLKDEIAKEVLKTACKIMIQKERGE